MAISLAPQETNKDPLQDVVKPGSGFAVVKPKGIVGQNTIIRIFPEVAPDGTIIPMVPSHDANGPLFSNITMEKMGFYLGTNTKFHGLVRPSDPGYAHLGDPDLPFAGLYIKLKGYMKRNLIPDSHYREVNQLLTKSNKGGAPLTNIQDHVMVQGMVLQINGQPCNPPMQKAIIILGSNATKGLQEGLRQAHALGIDVFDPVNGLALQFIPEAIAGSDVTMFRVVPVLNAQGTPALYPLPENLVRAWTPWDRILRRHTYDELIHRMVAAYGAGIVALKPSFCERMKHLGLLDQAPAPKTAYDSAQEAIHRAAPAASGLPVSTGGGWGQIQTPGTPAAASTPAAAPAAPVSAPVAGGWGAVTAPAAGTPPKTTTPAAGSSSSVEELERAFNVLKEKQKK